MKKKYLYLIAFLLPVSFGCYVVFTMYNKPHKIISEQPADFQLTVDEMMSAFEKNEMTARANFLNKVIVLEGILESIGASKNGLQIVMLKGDKGIANCEFLNEDLMIPEGLNPGDRMAVKGLFIGYDDLLGELQLKKCTVIPPDSQL